MSTLSQIKKLVENEGVIINSLRRLGDPPFLSIVANIKAEDPNGKLTETKRNTA